MNVVVASDAHDLARRAADVIERVIRAHPGAALLFATGNTPMATYAELARRVAEQGLDCSGVLAVQLDEYVGVTDDDPRSLWAWMQRAVVNPLRVERTLRLTDVRTFDGDVARAGGLDLAILGLGPNGHLGFNEPPCGPDAGTREVTLTPESLRSNAAYYTAEVPRRARTAGMTTILGARAQLLLVSGRHKRDILRRTLHDPPTPEVPATWLRLGHATVIADRDALPTGGAEVGAEEGRA